MDKKKFNITEAAQILEISEPTVKNWIKKNLLPKDLNSVEVLNFKEDIKIGKIEILNKRANKSNSKNYFIPNEYANNKGILSPIKKIIELSKELSDIKIFLFNLSYCYLIAKQEITELFGFYEYKRQIIKTILDEYSENLMPDNEYIYKCLPHFSKLIHNNCEDILGILYQSFRSEGNKSKHGSYYTPHDITNSINDSLAKITTYFDPCCGTGSFLINAAKTLNLKPENIFGNDIDENAVFIAKLNILLQYPNYQQQPQIYCKDIIHNSSEKLKSELQNKFDAIVTNPPWGALKNTNNYDYYKNIINSNEIFSMFLVLSTELLKQGGDAVFVLPKSFLNIKIHSTIRKFLIENNKILSISEIGKQFSNVFTSVILLHIKKTIPQEDHKILIINKNSKFLIFQNKILKTKDNVIEINLNEDEQKIIDKIYSIPHKTLKNNAKWVLGIITGNNTDFLSKTKAENSEKIIKGTDIFPFKIKEPETFIKFDINKLQQVAAEKLYRTKEKIVYRFISDKLIFAIDNSGYLTLNSANILIPKIKGHSIKTIIAFLNSSVFQFIFTKKFSTHKILRNNLEELPFPEIIEEQKIRLEELVDKVAIDDNIIKTIDEMIFEIFKLEDFDIMKII
ncbi:MAG: N-6 DNA methylase [Bacteroidales bacterium]|nr:N-6 DNA methylase [Bacteroidales bacterium]